MTAMEALSEAEEELYNAVDQEELTQKLQYSCPDSLGGVVTAWRSRWLEQQMEALVAGGAHPVCPAWHFPLHRAAHPLLPLLRPDPVPQPVPCRHPVPVSASLLSLHFSAHRFAHRSRARLPLRAL